MAETGAREAQVELKRTFGMREAITITAGTVIGVGLFTTGGNVVGELGSNVVWATLLAMIISIFPALLYAEMGAARMFAAFAQRILCTTYLAGFCSYHDSAEI